MVGSGIDTKPKTEAERKASETKQTIATNISTGEMYVYKKKKGRNTYTPIEEKKEATPSQPVYDEKKYVNSPVQKVEDSYRRGTSGQFLRASREATKQGYAIAEPGDSINLSNPKSETRRGRVGIQIANTLDTACNQAVVEPQFTEIAVHPISKKLEFKGFKDGNCPALLATDYKAPKCVQYSNFRIRRLTPLECWRLQGFPDEAFYKAKSVNSDTQLYKQAGNSISTTVIKAIIENLVRLLR